MGSVLDPLEAEQLACGNNDPMETSPLSDPSPSSASPRTALAECSPPHPGAELRRPGSVFAAGSREQGLGPAGVLLSLLRVRKRVSVPA
ncbi:hypothetical protein Y1Q_0006689 [Alligator mississippiensis]|uniref:Uncharacterized protein n=1 Tax=Alligator mississippiensis TaxID=8496 RepID=A0A151NT86_ALLMI|nr:hypothetical protein Y1Q_0006689 [Alligator mississippiensis]